MDVNETIGFLGAGSMAEAMIAGLLKNKVYLPESIIVTNRSNRDRLKHLTERYGVRIETDREAFLKQCSHLVLAMKPKDMPEAIAAIRQHLSPSQTLLSVAAGISTAWLEEQSGLSIPVIRAMPNTSAAVGYSATAACLGRYAGESQKRWTEKIFHAMGQLVWVEEWQMDVVTGVAGSGPAYFYAMVETLEKAGMELGLSPEIARQLSRQTFIGAARMLEESGERPEALRERVTSPGGTTMAGLARLAECGFHEALREAVKAAVSRSRELGI
ncbi:MAG: pyrroline-5-carboxylate reductase [Bacillus thermozeamaize]|uniref:Pyrroline-5-carboxylate reductase n=1 Tax=Bacillus thermozeamaize TaxID=230954 RepID=A0A1Y3PLM0_9BACI|nr:MAG: pyrroline-5-carboxylate reductase [Bacillus thermozeamaize]